LIGGGSSFNRNLSQAGLAALQTYEAVQEQQRAIAAQEAERLRLEKAAELERERFKFEQQKLASEEKRVKQKERMEAFAKAKGYELDKERNEILRSQVAAQRAATAAERSTAEERLLERKRRVLIAEGLTELEADKLVLFAGDTRDAEVVAGVAAKIWDSKFRNSPDPLAFDDNKAAADSMEVAKALYPQAGVTIDQVVEAIKKQREGGAEEPPPEREPPPEKEPPPRALPGRVSVTPAQQERAARIARATTPEEKARLSQLTPAEGGGSGGLLQSGLRAVAGAVSSGFDQARASQKYVGRTVQLGSETWVVVATDPNTGKVVMQNPVTKEYDDTMQYSTLVGYLEYAPTGP